MDHGNKCFAVFFTMLMGSGVLAHLQQFKYSSGTPYDEIINLFIDKPIENSTSLSVLISVVLLGGQKSAILLTFYIIFMTNTLLAPLLSLLSHLPHFQLLDEIIGSQNYRQITKWCTFAMKKCDRLKVGQLGKTLSL